MVNPLKVIKKAFKGRKGARGYNDLHAARLLSDWIMSTDDANDRLTQHLGHLRKMCRDLAETNKYTGRYLDLRVMNVVGPNGFQLQSRATDRNGNKDQYARNVIESKWREWKLPEFCTVSGDMHGNDEDRLHERTLAVDGEVFILVYPGFDNEHRFAIRTISTDFVDHEYNLKKLPNGNRVVMGKELTPQGQCVAIWLTGEQDGALIKPHQGGKRSRIPCLNQYMKSGGVGAPSKSGYILHHFAKKRPEQQRGVSDLVYALESLRHLERTEEAHHMAARLASCAVFQRVDDNADDWDYEESERFADQMQVTPGFVLRSGLGRKWEILQPQFPNTALPDHAKQTLQGAGASLGISYNAFSGDLEGTSYSSGRLGSLTERDCWKTKQNEAINGRIRPIFNAWLRTQLAYNILGGLAFEEEKKYQAAHIQARRWDHIDPLKDSAGRKSDLQARLTSPQRVIAERGDDIEEVLNEWAEYEALVESKGLIATDFRSSELEASLSKEEDEEDIEEKYFYDKDKKKKKKKKS
jgi:lambda family phage portal protein